MFHSNEEKDVATQEGLFSFGYAENTSGGGLFLSGGKDFSKRGRVDGRKRGGAETHCS